MSNLRLEITVMYINVFLTSFSISELYPPFLTQQINVQEVFLLSKNKCNLKNSFLLLLYNFEGNVFLSWKQTIKCVIWRQVLHATEIETIYEH